MSINGLLKVLYLTFFGLHQKANLMHVLHTNLILIYVVIISSSYINAKLKAILMSLRVKGMAASELTRSNEKKIIKKCIKQY